jgi:uncharacterized glyoxalase superfamily protein PhnB
MQTHMIPCLRYDDAPAAIAFLCRAFGFVRHAVYADDSDPKLIHHAQLTLNGAMVMLSSARPGEATDKYAWRTPAEAGGITMCIYGVIEDLDGHAAAARAAGAVIVTEPQDNPGYPGRGYSARDPEGNMWSFGSYDPFAVEHAAG